MQNTTDARAPSWEGGAERPERSGHKTKSPERVDMWVAALENRLLTEQRLLAIAKLKHDYATKLDSKDWPAVQRLLTADVDLRAEGRHFTSAAAFVELLSELLTGVRTKHKIFAPLELRMTGPDAAVGMWPMTDRLEWPPENPGGPVRGITWRGYYKETYLVTPDGPRISALELLRTGEFEELEGGVPPDTPWYEAAQRRRAPRG